MTDTQTQAEQPPAPEATPPATPDPTPKASDGRDAPSDTLGEPGLKALQREREAREKLEKEVGPLRQQMEALRRAFGGESTEGKPEDVVANLQQQVSQMQRDSLVNDVARRHGITSDDDVALLRGATDADHMARLAERLKVTPGPTGPAPDQGQGARPTTPQAEADAEYARYFPN